MDNQRWFLFLVAVVATGFVYLLAPILTPFLAGALLAYLCDPLADRLEDAGVSRNLAVVAVFVGLSLFVLIAVLVVLPNIGHQIGVLISQVPTVIGLVESRFIPWLEVQFGIAPTLFNIDLLKNALLADWQKTGNVMVKLVTGITHSGLAVAAWVANLILIPVVTFYLLRDWDIMIEKIRRLLPLNIEPYISTWARECDDVLGAFMKGQLLVMFALGIIYAVGLWLVGLDLAMLIGMLAGLASIVPYMGFVVGIAAALIAALIQFNDPTVLFWVCLVFAIGQAIEGMVLTPLLVGDKIGLHPVAVIFAIMAGGQLFGFVGVLLALPVAAVIMVALRHLHDGYKVSSLYAHPNDMSGELAGDVAQEKSEIAKPE